MSRNVKYDEEFIMQNNARILSLFRIQPRYRYKPHSEPEVRKHKKELSDDEKRMLMAVNIYQYRKSMTEITKATGFSAGKSSRMLNALERAGMVKIISISKGRGISRYPVLLEPAYRILGIEPRKFSGRGAGHEHVLWQHLLAEHFLSFSPRIEFSRNNKFIDLAFETGGFLVGIEVALASVHEQENIRRDFEIAAVDFVVVACRNRTVANEVLAVVSGMDAETRQKTRVCLLGSIISSNPEEFVMGILKTEVNDEKQIV